MKRKLKIDDLTVAAFSTGEDDLARARGTVRGASDESGETNCWESMLAPQSCVYACPVTRDTCYATCDDVSCVPTCIPRLCS